MASSSFSWITSITNVFFRLFGFLIQQPTRTFQSLPTAHGPVILSNSCEDSIASIIQQAIDSAKTSLFLRMYRITSPIIIQGLIKKLDHFCKTTIHYQFFKEVGLLQNHALPITLIGHSGPRGKIMHQKVLVIDNLWVLIGTANYTESSLTEDNNVIVCFKSKELSSCVIEDVSGKFKINEQLVQYYVLPKDRASAFNAILTKIKTAQSTIRVAMYALTHQTIIQELQRAHQRGVQVEVILDKERLSLCTINSKKPLFPIFCKTGSGKLHSKMCIIDQTTFIIGSVNWSKSGFSLNSENILILESITQLQKHKLSQIWASFRNQAEALN